LVEVEVTTWGVVLVVQAVEVTVVGVHDLAGGGLRNQRFSSAGERMGRPILMRSALVSSSGMPSFFQLLRHFLVVVHDVQVEVRVGVAVTQVVGVRVAV
jgi:hypothetical protein